MFGIKRRIWIQVYKTTKPQIPDISQFCFFLLQPVFNLVENLTVTVSIHNQVN